MCSVVFDVCTCVTSTQTNVPKMQQTDQHLDAVAKTFFDEQDKRRDGCLDGWMECSPPPMTTMMQKLMAALIHSCEVNIVSYEHGTSLCWCVCASMCCLACSPTNMTRSAAATSENRCVVLGHLQQAWKGCISEFWGVRTETEEWMSKAFATINL